MTGTILLVDDHSALRRSLRAWLEVAFQGCTILEAGTGEEAVQISLDAAPDVIVMDIGLPQMSGIEAARRIKAQAPAAQIVFLTIHEDDAHRDDALQAGACAYIPKRFLHAVLIPTLTRLLPPIAEALRPQRTP